MNKTSNLRGNPNLLPDNRGWKLKILGQATWRLSVVAQRKVSRTLSKLPESTIPRALAHTRPVNTAEILPYWLTPEDVESIRNDIDNNLPLWWSTPIKKLLAGIGWTDVVNDIDTDRALHSTNDAIDDGRVKDTRLLFLKLNQYEIYQQYMHKRPFSDQKIGIIRFPNLWLDSTKTKDMKMQLTEALTSLGLGDMFCTPKWMSESMTKHWIRLESRTWHDGGIYGADCVSRAWGDSYANDPAITQHISASTAPSLYARDSSVLCSGLPIDRRDVCSMVLTRKTS